MISTISAHRLSFSLPNDRNLFRGLSLTLGPAVTALVGPNGVGKTCLARLLAGELEPSEGTILRRSQVTYFAQRLVPGTVSVSEYLADEYIWSERGEALLAGIDRSALCTHLSGGQWMRVRLARSLHSGFLILDEPTNDLDRDGRMAVLQFLREREGGVLLISHDRECLALCQEVLELSNRGLTRYGEGWNAYELEREREREALSSALESAKRKREVVRAERAERMARQEKRNRRGKEIAATGGMPKILLGARKRQAEATTGRVDVETVTRAKDAVREAFEKFQQLKIDPIMYVEMAGREIPTQKLIAEATGFNVRFTEWIYRRDLNFVWRGNARVVLRGTNGSGKSTLIRALSGMPLETRGVLKRAQLVSLYLDQSCSTLVDGKSVLENVRDVSGAPDHELRNSLARFLFTKESVFQKVGSLSGGERLRAALAKGFLANAKPELLILDEPTNNLDLPNVRFLEELVRLFRGPLLVVSHDELFVKNCGVNSELEVA